MGTNACWRTDLPLAAQKRAWRYIGGLLFEISFQSGKMKGQIENQPDEQILKRSSLAQWSVDDYILMLEAVGS